MKPTLKITIIFLLLSTLYPCMAQENPSGKVTLDVRNKPLSEVLNQVTQQTGIHFSYNPQSIDTQSKITVHIQNKDLTPALQSILPKTITYKQRGKNIILSPLEIKEPPVEPVIFPQEQTGIKAGAIEEANNIEKIINPKSLIINNEEIILEKIPITHTGIPTEDCHNDVNLKNKEEMKKYLASLAIAASILAPQVTAQEVKSTEPEKPQKEYNEGPEAKASKAFQISFIYPIGSGGISSPETTYKSSLNVLGGVTGRTNGFELASLFNINKYSASGLQISGGFNLTGYAPAYHEYSNVFQISSIFNYTRAGRANQITGFINVGDITPFQAGGIANISSIASFQAAGAINYMNYGSTQFAGIFNGSKSKSDFQVAGGVNYTKQGGAQISGITNIASTSACQITGAVNTTGKGRFQLSGIANVASESNCQITGLVNVTGKGGFQLGIINVRDTADGVSLGIINIVKHGGVLEFGIEGGEFIQTAATFRSGTQKLYSILSLGYNYSEKFWAIGLGLGTAFKFNKTLGLNLEFMYQDLKNMPYDGSIYNGLVQIRPLFNVRIADHFKIFLGPTANLLVQSNYYNGDGLNFEIAAPYSLYEASSDYARVNAWVGFTGGIKF